MKKLILFSSLFILSNVSFAQRNDDFVLKGQLIDQETRKPIPFASILLINKSKGIASASDGRFSFPVSVGDSIKISFVGYSDYFLEITETIRDQKEPLTIFMKTEALELGTFEIFGLSEDFYLRRKIPDTLKLDLPLGISQMPLIGPPDQYVPTSYQQFNLNYSISIFNILDKNPKQARIIRAMEASEAFQKQRKAQRDAVFNKEIVKRITRIDDRVIDEFMAFCNFLDGELIGKSDYEITVKILNKYKAFLKR